MFRWVYSLMKAPRRRTVLKTLASAGVLSAAAVGTTSANGRGERAGASGEETIVDIAVAADGFDVLVAAVEAAGLVETLSGNRQLTVLAPTDEAFADAEITEENVGDLEASFLADVLTYHVSPGRRYADSVVEAPQLPTLNGASIDVDGVELNDSQAQIVGTDIEASNGVIHVIDGVLLP
jgi:uncharacterized surface protein with fasciclin (FAS1) repeats